MKEKRTQEELFYALTEKIQGMQDFPSVLQNDFDAAVEAGIDIVAILTVWKNAYYSDVSDLEVLVEEVSEFIQAKNKKARKKGGK